MAVPAMIAAMDPGSVAGVLVYENVWAAPFASAMRRAGGQLIANPIPVDAEISRAEITPHIEAALAEAEARGIAAKAVTPFLLQRIFELTSGRSLTANIALVLNNARLAAAIASELAAKD